MSDQLDESVAPEPAPEKTHFPADAFAAEPEAETQFSDDPQPPSDIS